jgi:hypothetical protein
MNHRSGPSYDTSISTSPVSGREKAPSSKEDIASFVESVLEFNKKGRQGFDEGVRQAIHFVGGDQWIQYLPYTQRFSLHQLDDWVPTPTTNIIGRTFDRLMDILLEGDPTPTAFPATQDQRDVDAATAASRIMLSEARRMNSYEKLYSPAAAWLIVSGNCIVTHSWNPHAGTKVKEPKTRKNRVPRESMRPICQNCGAEYDIDYVAERCQICNGPIAMKKSPDRDDYGGQTYDTKTEDVIGADGRQVMNEYRIGQVEEHAVNVLNFYPHPVADPDKMRHAVEVEAMDLDEIKDTFGSKAKDVVAEHLDYSELDISHPHHQGFSGNELSRDRDKAQVKFLRHVPGRMFKNGCFAIVANGHLLHKGDLPGDSEKLPYRIMRWREIPGSFWGMSPLTDLIRIQKRINAIDSHLISNRKRMVNPQWLIPHGSGVGKLDGRAGLSIRYDPHGAGGLKPEIIPGVPLPAQVMEERRMIMSDYQEISGEMEVLLGRIPPGVESGYQVDLLVEQALKRFGPIYKRFRLGLSDHHREQLILCEANWTESRKVQVLGDNKVTEVHHYRGADLRNSSDIVVELSSELEASPAVRRTRIQNALSQGLLGDPQRPEVRGKILAKLGIEGFDSEYSLDAKKAQRIIISAQEGSDLPELIPGIDNAAVQLQILKEHMLTREYEQAEDSIKEAIQSRSEELMKIAQQEQQKAMAAAQAAKGTDPATSQMVAQSGAMGDAAVPTT